MPDYIDSRPQGTVRRDDAPGTTSDGSLAYFRASRHGEQVVQPLGRSSYPLCDEGSYFVATNPTPGTAIAGIAAADGYEDDEALLYLENTHASKHVYLDYLLLTCKVAGTSGTDFAYAIDVATEATYASGATAITPVDTNRETNNTAPVTMYFGAVVTTTGTTEKIVSHGLLRTVIKVIGDQYLFSFGKGVASPMNATIMEGTDQASITRNCPPIVVPPGHAMCFREFAASQDGAAQYQFELGFWAR
jgi:hypothetical protein